MDRKELIKETQDRYNFVVTSYNTFKQEDDTTCSEKITPIYDDFVNWMMDNYPTNEELTNEEVDPIFFSDEFIDSIYENDDIKLQIVLIGTVRKMLKEDGVRFMIKESNSWNRYSTMYQKFILKN